MGDLLTMVVAKMVVAKMVVAKVDLSELAPDLQGQ
jgi:hypothetical protein